MAKQKKRWKCYQLHIPPIRTSKHTHNTITFNSIHKRGWRRKKTCCDISFFVCCRDFTNEVIKLDDSWIDLMWTWLYWICWIFFFHFIYYNIHEITIYGGLFTHKFMLGSSFYVYYYLTGSVSFIFLIHLLKNTRNHEIKNKKKRKKTFNSNEDF